ncbi:putative FAD-binding domain, FAD/NAD(P)-binding domain superfamily [Arabidopsis thaliana]|uniref:CTF2B n=3 Tax=Arabidopsis TaxID=3701 RepID=A0A178VVT9_ARATH|nr:CTF2B [Arabidopsis thaliana]KAG7637897.1 FAD/NAD(P)-binding domain superfamily [Arabidopsis thaliana x Arabidopsis arenosa]OAP10507.1 CTF2B [Arabidopsis thaliana]
MSLVRPIYPFLARSKRWFPVRTGLKPVCLTTTRAETSGVDREEKVVIVGGGIGGLATAVALHRLGIRSVVLEQAESLRTGGASLTLSKNGWRVLDAISIGPQLRKQFLEMQGVVLKKEDGRELRSFKFKDNDQSQEVRAVERRVLLETLASQLPPQTIRFSSKLESIQSNDANGDTLLQLKDGTRFLANIVIGCDGIRSKVATWMGFSEPKYVGYCAFRGLGFFPNGQPFQQKVNYIFGRGLRAGYVPVSATKVYWFITFNSPSLGPQMMDPAILRKEAKELVSTWPDDLQNLIDLTPDEAISRTPLADRWLWPGIAPSASKGRVVLVGDAWHPMTPNLGQGACCALEDSVLLANKLARAINGGTESVERAMESYRSERWSQVFRLTVLANLVGKLLQSDNPLVCSVRDNIVSAMGKSSRTNDGTHKL